MSNRQRDCILTHSDPCQGQGNHLCNRLKTWDLLLNNLNGYQFRPVEILRDVVIRCSTSYVWIQTFQKPDESFMAFNIRKISVCLYFQFITSLVTLNQIWEWLQFASSTEHNFSVLHLH